MDIDLSDITAAFHATHGPRASRHQVSDRLRPMHPPIRLSEPEWTRARATADIEREASISGGLAGNAVPYRHALFRLSMTLANRIRARPLLAQVDRVAFVSEGPLAISPQFISASRRR
jgi:hypothetical protein